MGPTTHNPRTTASCDLERSGRSGHRCPVHANLGRPLRVRTPIDSAVPGGAGMRLDELGWRGAAPAGEAVGRVAVEHREGFVLYTEAGELPATLAGRLRHDERATRPAVGDWVSYRA